MDGELSLPIILENVFKKFSNTSSENIGDLFVELDALLPRVVESALHLLDHLPAIVVYHNPSKTREVAEIKVGPLQTVRLFPRINYCSCEYFQQKVLAGNGEPSTHHPYTCEHVLALRLAFLLESDKLRFEELPTSRLKSLQSHFMPEDINSD